MKKFSLLSILLCLVVFDISAQKQNDSTESKKTLHFVGLQANLLVRQVFNFGNANNPINSPYLLTYSIIDRKSKWGVDVGLGYTLNSTFENDGNTKKENNINDLYFRIGAQKLIPLNKRFVALANVHILYDMLNSKTKTESDFGGQIQKITSNTSSTRFGLGPCLGLRYRVSNRVFIGTEASYYFKMGNSKSNVKSEIYFQGQIQQSTESDSNNDLKQFVFNVPTALYLTVRF